MPRVQSQQTIVGYNDAQVAAVLDRCGIEVVAETVNDYLAYCPYHGNMRTPSFSVSKSNSKFLCFNGSCAESGTLTDLVRSSLRVGEFEAARIIHQAGEGTEIDFKDQLELALKPVVEFEPFSQEILDRLKKDFWNDSQGLKYMRGRGFDDATLEDYSIGYSSKRNQVAVPMHTADGVLIGLIGRSASNEVKIFKNSTGLHTSKTLYNLHRAKRTGDTAIVVESAFDVMGNAQAGYPNTVACLGGHLSAMAQWQLEKYFSTIIIMTDFDDKDSHKYLGCKACANHQFSTCQGHNPGRALGETISERVTNKTVLWAAYDYKVVYPDGAKDVCNMTIPERRQCIKNAVSNYEYHTWGIQNW